MSFQQRNNNQTPQSDFLGWVLVTSIALVIGALALRLGIWIVSGR